MDMKLPIRICDTVISRSLRGRTVVLDVQRGRYFQLQGSSAEIWRSLEAGVESVSALVDAVGRRHAAAASIDADVVAFVESALEQGLLETGSGQVRAESGPDDRRVLRIGKTKLVQDDLDGLRRDFERQHYVRLPQLLDEELRDLIANRIDDGPFVDRTHEGIGTELCLVPGLATSALQLLFNDPDMLAAISQIADCPHVGCFDGRVYRMSPSAGHYDSWHSDAGEDRLVAISLNFGRERYEGGVLEIRSASSPEPVEQVPNPGFGDAVMFRISPALRHRVSAVSGSTPRTAYAGWFRSSPDFPDLFFASLPKD